MIPEPHYRRDLRAAAIVIAACVVLLVALPLVPALYFHLPGPINTALHTLLETVSIVVSGLVFAVGWHTVARRPSASVALVSCAFLGVALLDFVHSIAYEGMPDFAGPSGNGKAIVFFLAARLLTAVALLGIASQGWSRPIGDRARYGMLAATLAFALGVSFVGLADPGVKRLFLVPGEGLTPLKVALEYALVALYLAAAVVFARRLGEPQPVPAVHLFAAASLMAVSELCFTLYTASRDSYNLLGHVTKVLAAVYVYRAIVMEMLQRPYEELFAARQLQQASERRYRLLFDTSLDGVVIADAAGGIEFANPAACRLLGYTEEELKRVGRSALVDVRQPGVAALLRERDRLGYARGEFPMRRADGSELDVEVSSVLIDDEAGRRLSGVFIRDITPRKHFEQEIMRLNADLEQRVAQRTAELEAVNRELERFAAAVAHDLRAPLAAIDGFSEALATLLGPDLPPKAAHYLQRVRGNAQRMEEMIAALLELARVSRQPLRREPLDLSVIAQQVLARCAERDPGRVISLDVAPSLAAHGDRQLVTLLLENLIGNAWKFTARVPAARIEVGVTASDGERAYFVRDNGAGFDMAHVGKLFGMFQRLHGEQDFPGSGIGLVNVRRIVERHGGRVWAEGAPGEGAVFRFTLGEAEPGFADGR